MYLHPIANRADGIINLTAFFPNRVPENRNYNPSILYKYLPHDFINLSIVSNMLFKKSPQVVNLGAHAKSYQLLVGFDFSFDC